MATENIMMEAVKMGGDRQELHEKIRVHSMEAGKVVKQEGKQNDLIDRICSDPSFKLKKEDVLKVLKPENYIGRAPQQVDDFIKDYTAPVINKYKSLLGVKVAIDV
jgi:adenylosuccinate lyase